MSGSPPPLRLLAVSPSSLAGGAERTLARALRQAVSRGWSVRCLCPGGPLATELEASGISVLRIPELKLPAGRRAVAMARLGLRSVVAAWVMRGAASADVVLVNGPLALPAVRLAAVGAPVVLVAHEVVRRPDRVRLLRACRKTLAGTVAVSRAAAAALADAGIQARFVANGTEWPVAPALAVPPSPPVVGCVAALTPGKGQAVLLDAVAALDRSDVVVEMVGSALPKDDAYASSLRRRAEETDLAGRVMFLGHMSDPLDRLRRWTVAVSASTEPEAGPLTVLEAMSAGVAVVATDNGGTPEVLGDAGLLVPPGEPQAMAAALRRVIEDPSLRQRCAAAGPAIVASRYQASRRSAELVDAIADLARADLARADLARADLARTTLPWRRGDRAEVVVAIPDFDPAIGGTSRQGRHQAEELIRRGRPSVVVTRRRRSSWAGRQVIDGLPVIRLRPAGDGALADKLSVLSLAGWLVLHRRRVAIVEVIMYADFAVSAWAAGLGRRTVMIWAGEGDATDVLGPAPGPVRSLQQGLRRRALAGCHHVALTSTLDAELRVLGLNQRSVIPVPVDVARFRPPTSAERQASRLGLGLSPDEFAIVYTGHLRALKGLDRLVSSFEKLVRSGQRARLFVVGGGSGPDECEEALRAQVMASGLDEQVRFTGIVDDVERYLWAADAFVLPSHREGMSNSLVEAMASGLPCVAATEAGGDQLLGDGAGMVPPSNEPEHLFQALSWLAADEGLRRAMGRVAAARAGEFSVERVGDRYEALIAAIGPPGPRKGR